MKSYVIDIQHCSIHDGPGIRTTVFLKGCPLKCKWCHNPESQNFHKELSYNSSLCTNCNSCLEVCKSKAHTIINEVHTVDFDKCTLCGECTKACENKSLTIIGKEMTAKEVFNIVVKDKVFYAEGNGGLTISGGEALSHIEFSLELLKLCKEHEIHTCIETSGYTSIDNINKILPYVDLFLFDFKVSNEEDAKKYIGQSLYTINKSFEYIYTQEKNIILRCPIIPSVNDTKSHFDNICNVIKTHPNLLGVELLPYHNFGVSKGNNIGKETDIFICPTDKEKQEWINYFKLKRCTKVTL